MIDEAEYANLIGKHLSGNINREEQTKLIAWKESSTANQTFFEDMEKTWRISDEYQDAPFDTDWEKAWTKVDAKTSQPPQFSKIVNMTNWRQINSIAAVILVLIAIGWWWSSTKIIPEIPIIIVSTSENEKLEYTLPDGSIVWLNENTMIEFLESFKKRELSLEGEAFFDVERLEESPFEIFSGKAKTRVLGTSFNVRAYPLENLIEVTVETGTVEFSKNEPTAQKVILTKGNSGVFEKKTEEIVKETKGFSNADTWKTEEYHFDDFRDVLLSIERYFDVEIEVKNRNILNCNFTNTGKLGDLNLSILKELIEFQTSNNIRLEKKGKKYILKGKGCEM